jgi:lipopolysaccharide transport system permease protein
MTPMLRASEPPPLDSRPIKIIRSSQSLGELVRGGVSLLFENKHLIFEMTLLRLKVRYRQSILGWAWAVIPPLVLTFTYAVIFGKVMHLSSGDMPYGLFVFAGLVPWTFLSTSVSNATSGMVQHRYLISRVSFPREVIPVSYVATALVDLGVISLMLLAMVVYYGVSLSGTAVYLIPILVVLVICTTAIALCFSAIQARVRDLGIAMPLLLQILMFTTPIVYPSDIVPDSVRGLYFMNPLAVLVEAFRQAAVQGVCPDVGRVLYSAVISSIMLALAYTLFKRLDATLADVL